MVNESQHWELVESLKWELDHNYKRIGLEITKLDKDTFNELRKFVDKKAEDLENRYRDAWLGNDGGPGIDASDDSWSDLRYEVWIVTGKQTFSIR